MRQYEPDATMACNDATIPLQPPMHMHEESERIRLRFRKTGPISLLSHLEMLTLFTRAVGRARIPIKFSQGFHPHPKFSFATALSVGVESLAEYFDMEIDAGFGAENVQKKLNAILPEGVLILEARAIPQGSPSLAVIVDRVSYRVTLAESIKVNLPALAEAFMARETFPYRRENKNKVAELDLRLEMVTLHAYGNVLEMTIRHGKPLEFASAVTALPLPMLAGARIEKLQVFFTSEW
jgi:radical SAM-linked protein